MLPVICNQFIATSFLSHISYKACLVARRARVSWNLIYSITFVHLVLSSYVFSSAHIPSTVDLLPLRSSSLRTSSLFSFSSHRFFPRLSLDQCTLSVRFNCSVTRDFDVIGKLESRKVVYIHKQSTVLHLLLVSCSHLSSVFYDLSPVSYESVPYTCPQEKKQSLIQHKKPILTVHLCFPSDPKLLVFAHCFSVSLDIFCTCVRILPLLLVQLTLQLLPIIRRSHSVGLYLTVKTVISHRTVVLPNL